MTVVSSFWRTADGKIIVDSDRNFIKCSVCPCTKTGASSSSSSSSSHSDPFSCDDVPEEVSFYAYNVLGDNSFALDYSAKAILADCGPSGDPQISGGFYVSFDVPNTPIGSFQAIYDSNGIITEVYSGGGPVYLDSLPPSPPEGALSVYVVSGL